MSLINFAMTLIFGTIFLALIRLVWRLNLYDATEYQKTKARYPSFLAVLRGQTRVKRDTIPDGRVSAGIVYNKRHKRIEAQGKLSNDILDQVLK